MKKIWDKKIYPPPTALTHFLIFCFSFPYFHRWNHPLHCNVWFLATSPQSSESLSSPFWHLLLPLMIKKYHSKNFRSFWFWHMLYLSSLTFPNWRMCLSTYNGFLDMTCQSVFSRKAVTKMGRVPIIVIIFDKEREIIYRKTPFHV